MPVTPLLPVKIDEIVVSTAFAIEEDIPVYWAGVVVYWRGEGGAAEGECEPKGRETDHQAHFHVSRSGISPPSLIEGPIIAAVR